MFQIVRRTGGRGKMEDVAYLSRDVHRIAHVQFHKLKLRVSFKMREVLLRPGDQIIERQNFPTLFEQPVAKMRSKKTRSSRNHRAHAPSRSRMQRVSVPCALWIDHLRGPRYASTSYHTLQKNADAAA